jgi:hypothetical protein
VTAVAEPEADSREIIDLDSLSPEQISELFEQLQTRFPPPDGDELPTAIQALMRVMQEVQAIAKDGDFNERGVRYKFRGVDAVMKAVGPALRRHQLLPVPWVEDVRQGQYTTSGGSVMRDSVTFITYKIYGPRGDFVEARMAGEKANSSDKSVAQSQSVAYRQLWLQLLCIPTDEPDPDQTNPDRGDQAGYGAAAREANQPSRETLLETVATTSTELRTLLGAGEYDWLEWLAKCCQKDFSVNIVKVRTEDGPVEEIDLGKLRTNQLSILWNRLSGMLKDTKKKRAADEAMAMSDGDR